MAPRTDLLRGAPDLPIPAALPPGAPPTGGGSRSARGSGLAHALAGALLGLAAALAGTRALTAVLFDVSPGDPVTLALATGALLLVALAACWIPARRAAGILPLEAIRHE